MCKQTQESEYANSGVDYKKIEPFKREMIAVGKKTIDFPLRHGVRINTDVLHSHGAVYELIRPGKTIHYWCNTKEGLGNKNWIAEWMYQFDGTGNSHYEGIGIDNFMMAANDNIAQGARPVVYVDEIAAPNSEWFKDERRAADLARGFYKGCELTGVALPAGESSSLRYLVRSEPPVLGAPVLSGTITGLIYPASRLITGKGMRAGLKIIGVTSSGLQANGASLVIKRGLTLPDKFLTKIPGGKTYGEEALIPTRSYVALIAALQDNGIRIPALLPGTGDGVGKVAFDDRQFTYRIYKDNWPKIPVLFQFLRELGVSIIDCLKTFNWGVGYYLFIEPQDVDEVIRIGSMAGYELYEVGQVEDGPRQTIFGPENDLVLPPPGN